MRKSDVLMALNNLELAYKRLDEAVKIACDELDKDGVIQRFEFTSELLWKTLKIILEYNKIDASGGPKDCIKEAFKYGYIPDDEIILDMLDDRNRSSHIYNEKISNEIFERIKIIYSAGIGEIIRFLKNKI
ncbi:MAG: nucleotidyltransferase substrate binding protein [Elusimicrobiota bacterium]